MQSDEYMWDKRDMTAGNIAFKKVDRGLYDVVAVCFVAFLLLSNIAATKLIEIGVGPLTLIFDGGAILFPLTYILGDVLSEVYGFRSAKRVILMGFAIQMIASLTFWLVQVAPSAADYANQDAFEAVLGVVPRFVLASLCGYLAGQLLNSIVLVRIKERFGENHLWVRLLGSTVVGEAADTTLFCIVAWASVVPAATIANLAITGFVYKVSVEAVFLPVTYVVIHWVKKREFADVAAHDSVVVNG
jgi:uncharacterized integral membrane protein (TIGR00697 family)